MDVKKALKQKESYPEVASIIQRTLNNTEEGYTYLYSLKNLIPKELYAYNLRTIWNMTTNGLSVGLALKMFEGVDPEDIMYEEELKAIEGFEDYITIYRGANKDETSPRLSWTLRKDVAFNNSEFAGGRLFKAIVSKKDILLYISKDCDEEEIVVYVNGECDIVDYD